MTKKPFVGQSAIANGLLDLVHTDVCGPLSILARGGFSYFITFTDDHSRYGYVYLMRYKSEAFGRFKEYRLEVENQTNRKIKALRSDRGVPRTPYKIWHSKPVSYKYLRVVYRISKKTTRYYFYDPAEQRSLPSRNVVFLEKGFLSDNRRDEVLIEESSGEPHHESTTSFELTVHSDGIPVLRRSTRESRVPERYGFVGLTSQLDNDPKTYREAMSDIDSDKWLEAIKFEMNSMGSNQPEGFTAVGEEKKVRRLQRSIYGLKQASQSWNTRFDEVIRGYDFIKNNCNHCIYKINGSSVAYLVLYVDDILLIENDVKMLGDIKAWLSTQFSMKDIGEASYILGIKIYRDRSRRMLGLTQSSYIEKVLKRFKMEHLKRGILPMRHGIKLSKKQSPKTDEELKKISNIPYSSAVGSIQYVVQCTRPNVAYALSVTSTYQACAGEVHWGAVKSIFKYLKRTKDMFLIYGGGELILEGCSDSNFQSDDDDAKFQSGFVFKLNGGVVAWKSSKQDTIADSTTEAEYITALEAVKEAVWMKNYIQELGVVPSIAEPVVIFCDNNGAIAQTKEPRSHHPSKHILRRYHLPREMVSRVNCRMDRVNSAEITSDPLTKPMSQVTHTQHLDKMGLRAMSYWL
ncbi:UNVERIFIED_CONTAM: Retrovirus-related Pol polyprotein from transposon TNT 1-94 [Sesamum radiatum]|uniref:Retrovirus-related Pol polyprotein from transposon TNT 1-94 n=1 Tax=Sesamum radiatum TaxID=300843 RepID=A0AAW2IRB7_SESRA